MNNFLIYKALCLYRLILGYEALHDAPCDEVGHSAEAEHYEVPGRFAAESQEAECFARILGVGEKVAGYALYEHGTHTAGHCAYAGYRGNGALGEHVAYGAEEVGAPCLMSCGREAYEDGGPPWRVYAQGLRKQREQGEECEDEHREHAAGVGMHALLFHEHLGKPAPEDGDYRHNRVEGEDECLTLGVGHLDAELVGEVARGPEEEEEFQLLFSEKLAAMAGISLDPC